MAELGFDSELFLKLQAKKIAERVQQFDKLYLEVGGKIVDDLHAARVLPGFDPQSKIKVLEQLRDQIEVIVCVSTIDLLRHKTRDDHGLSYAEEALRIINFFRQRGFVVNNLVLTLCDDVSSVQDFVDWFERNNLTVAIHSRTKGYPHDVDKVVSAAGYGKNSFIQTDHPVVVVTAPGPSSGKMATCLSQIYHEFLRGNRVGYAKYETFPVWNLPPDHPVNLAYEAATLDILDQNLIDPFHLKAYGVKATNYNRDIETFPVLNEIFWKIFGEEIYQSPTDMGVNMVTSGIINEAVVEQAAKQEIVRRYHRTKADFQLGKISASAVKKAEQLLMMIGLAAEIKQPISETNFTSQTSKAL